MSRTALDGAHSQHHDSLTNANFSTEPVRYRFGKPAPQTAYPLTTVLDTFSLSRKRKISKTDANQIRRTELSKTSTS